MNFLMNWLANFVYCMTTVDSCLPNEELHVFQTCMLRYTRTLDI